MANNASAYSRAYVNVGRSLRLSTRCDVSQVLYGSRASRSGALCIDGPGDKLWCTVARSRGYDSIQIARGTSYVPHTRRRKPWGELVACGEDCATRTYSRSACVPFAVTDGGGSCACAHDAQQLSCGLELQGHELPLTTLPGVVFGKQPEPLRRPECVGKATFDHYALLGAESRANWSALFRVDWRAALAQVASDQQQDSSAPP